MLDTAAYALELVKRSETWYFDDPALGIEDEAFVQGSSEIIDHQLCRIGRDRARAAVLLFDERSFRESTFSLTTLYQEQDGGMWYVDLASKMRGWLCPTTLKYFDSFPKTIYGRLIA